MDFIGVSSPPNPHYRLTTSYIFRTRPFSLCTEVMSYIATTKTLAMVVHALMQQMTMEPDNSTWRNFHRYAIFVANIAC